MQSCSNEHPEKGREGKGGSDKVGVARVGKHTKAVALLCVTL